MIKELNIDPEFKNIIPALSKDEFKQLEENIINEGCRDALVIWEGLILDGHNRYKICTENMIEFKTKEVFFEDRSEVIEWIIRNQFGRRNLQKYERSQLSLKLEDVLSKRAKKNQIVRKGNQASTTLTNSSKLISPINTRKEIAKEAGVSEDTIRKVKIIEKKATPEQKEALRRGEKKINRVFNEIKEKEKPREEKRICTDCGKLKPISEYTYDNYNKKHKTKCKKCINEIASMKFNLEKPVEKMDEMDRLYLEMKKPAPPQQEAGNKKTSIDPIITDFEELLKEFNRNINRFVYIDFEMFGLEDPTSLQEAIEENLQELLQIKNNLEELKNEKTI